MSVRDLHVQAISPCHHSCSVPRILLSVPSSSCPQLVSVAPLAMNAHYVRQRALRGERLLLMLLMRTLELPSEAER